MSASTDGQAAAGESSRRRADVVREQDRMMLLFAYLHIFSLLPLLTVRDSDYVRFHAKQGAVLAVAVSVWYALAFALSFVPHATLVVVAMCALGTVAYMGLCLFAIARALEPRRWRIPLLATLADSL